MTPSPVVLVLNSGSSSLKYQLIEPDSGESLADGTVEQIGEPSSPVTDHGAALRVAFEKLRDDGIDLKACGLVAVGHRVVHGGAVFYRPTVDGIPDETLYRRRSPVAQAGRITAPVIFFQHAKPLFKIPAQRLSGCRQQPGADDQRQSPAPQGAGAQGRRAVAYHRQPRRHGRRDVPSHERRRLSCRVHPRGD